MISSVEWVPRGVADPNPKQYELSAAEQELLSLNQAGYQEEEDDVLLDEQEEQAQETITTTKTVTLPKVDPNSLPAELRMDEYSSDEEHENEAVKGMSIGTLLVKTDEEDNDDKEQVMEDQDWETDDSDNDMDSDDDLNDIPDTREFAPTDLEGLQAMGLSHVGAGAAMNLEDQDDDDADDDDSDADDVRLSPDDAIIVVAKTEEVGGRDADGRRSSCRFQYSLILQHNHTLSHVHIFRTLLLWKFTCMKKRRETCLSITILHCPPFHFAWRMAM